MFADAKTDLRWTISRLGDMTKEQIDALFALRYEVFIDEQGFKVESPDDKESDTNDEHAYHVVGHSSEGVLLAYARIIYPLEDDGSKISFGRVCVAKASRGHQLGRRLLEKIKEHIAQQPCHIREVIITAQEMTKEFYVKGGFEVTSPAPFLHPPRKDYAKPHVEMKITIPYQPESAASGGAGSLSAVAASFALVSARAMEGSAADAAASAP